MFKWVAVSLFVALLLSFLWHENRVVKKAKDEVVKEYANDSIEQQIEAYKGEISLLNTTKEADHAIMAKQLALIADRDALIVGLRNRPSRKGSTETINTVTVVKEACTGRELYQEDGEFLIGEAARADKLIGERDYYYERYEAARIKLEELNGKD